MENSNLGSFGGEVLNVNLKTRLGTHTSVKSSRSAARRPGFPRRRSVLRLSGGRACGCSGRAVAVPRGAGLTPPSRTRYVSSPVAGLPSARCLSGLRGPGARGPSAVSESEESRTIVSSRCSRGGQPVLEASEVLPAVSPPKTTLDTWESAFGRCSVGGRPERVPS